MLTRWADDLSLWGWHTMYLMKPLLVNQMELEELTGGEERDERHFVLQSFPFSFSGKNTTPTIGGFLGQLFEHGRVESFVFEAGRSSCCREDQGGLTKRGFCNHGLC